MTQTFRLAEVHRIAMSTSCQSPHRRSRRTVQSYSPGGANAPSHTGILAPPGKYDWTCASFVPPKSTSKTANRSVQPVLHSSRQKVHILYNRPPFLKHCPSHGGSGTPSNLWFLGPIRAHNPNGISIGSAVFAQMTAEFPCTLQWDAPFPKIAPSHRGIWTPSNTWFLGPTWVLDPNGVSIGSAVFAWLTSVTDRETDRPR